LLRESLLRTVPVVFIVFVTLFRFQWGQPGSCLSP
jgi:hypothetical protein